jgi:IS30 family transposase
METTNNKPKLLVRVKNLQLVFDYCIENKLKFSVAPKLSNDEWEFELNISDIMSAVALGVFVRENRLDVIGLNISTPKVQAVTQTVAKPTKSAKPIAKKTTDDAGFLDIPTSNEASEIESSEFTEPVVLPSSTELAF